MNGSSENHCVVIGAGVIGIACGISLIERGYKVTICDSETPGTMTSSGNAGGFGFTDVMPMSGPGVIWRVPKWLLDPCGPLFIRPGHLPALVPWLWRFQKNSNLAQVEKSSHALSDILNHSMPDTRELVRKANLGDLFLEKGMITAYRSKQSFKKDQLEWKIKKDRGIEIEELGGSEIKNLEPALENVDYGIYTPQWCNTTEPFEFLKSMENYFSSLGGEIKKAQVTRLRMQGGKVNSIVTLEDETLKFDQFVIAAGVWSKSFCKQLGDRVLLESERGYNTTLPNPGVSLNRQITFGEEKFVITNIGNGLRIGGAAEFAGTETPANYKRSERLVEIARRYLPGLDDSGGEKWMGHRPSTPDSLPVIGPSTRYNNVYYAFGHSHAGLTMAATTGKMIAQMVNKEPIPFDSSPFHISRFN